jgi:hypothetical protein
VDARARGVSDPARPRQVGGPLRGHAGEVFAVAFGPGGLLASAGEDEVRLWDVSDPARPRQLGDPLHHPGSVDDVAFGPGGLLASAGAADVGAGGEVRLWDVSVLQRLRDDAVEEACRRAGRGLTRAEWTRYLPDEEYRDACDPTHRPS